MSLIDRGLDGVALLSGTLGAALQRRLRELGGVALLSLAMILALALATWSVQDPSLSHATDAPVRNLLGRPGAIAADLLMQLLGLGALALLLPIAVWGYRLLGHRPLSRERMRVFLWIIGAVLSAAFASCLPRSAHWPLPSGLGGGVGDAIVRLPAVLFNAPLAGTNQFAAAVILGAAAFITFAGAAGAIWRDASDDDDIEEDEEKDEPDDKDNDEGGGWISLGYLEHMVLSFRARLGRLLGRGRPASASTRNAPATPRRRVEPRFDQSPDLAPALEDDVEDEDEDEAAEAPRAPKKP